jgi:hypothetical protein
VGYEVGCCNRALGPELKCFSPLALPFAPWPWLFKPDARTSVEQALRAAQFRFDHAMHDLRSEFIVRENKLRDDYLAEVAGITASSE